MVQGTYSLLSKITIRIMHCCLLWLGNEVPHFVVLHIFYFVGDLIDRISKLFTVMISHYIQKWQAQKRLNWYHLSWKVLSQNPAGTQALGGLLHHAVTGSDKAKPMRCVLQNQHSKRIKQGKESIFLEQATEYFRRLLQQKSWLFSDAYLLSN